MNRNVFINTDQVDLIVQNINSIQSRLNETIEKQKDLKEKMHLAWGGTTGDKAYERLTKYETKYDAYINMLNKRIKFLQAVTSAYVDWDSLISKKVDENFSRKE